MNDVLSTLFALDAPDYDSWGGVPACVSADPESFFPERGAEGVSVQNNPIKRLCETCEVAESCLDYALQLPATDDYGIWGGTSAKERRKIRRERGIRPGRRPGPRQPCGTPAAARRHHRNGEPLCEPCRQAVSIYRDDLKQAGL